MKRLWILLPLLLSLTQLNAQEEEDEYMGKNGIAKMSVLGILGGQYQFAFEKKKTDFVTYQGSLGLIAGRRTFTGPLDTAKTQTGTFKAPKLGFIFIPEVRYYFRGTSAHGTYLAGMLRFRYSVENQTDNANSINSSLKNIDRKQALTSMGGGFSIGYQRASRKVTLDFFGGLLFNSVSEKTTYKNGSATSNDLKNRYPLYRNLDNPGAQLRLGFMIGIKI